MSARAEVSEFLSGLETRELSERRARLIAPLRYWSARLMDVIEVPAGFVTDYQSDELVRWAPLLYALVGNHHHRPAVIHDYLYATHRVSRGEADAVFYEACRSVGAPIWRAWMVWAGVRIGGWRAWGR